MPTKQKRALIKPQNLAAKALGEKRFSAKIVEQKQKYSRKVKFKKGRIDVDHSPFYFAHMDALGFSCNVCA